MTPDTAEDCHKITAPQLPTPQKQCMNEFEKVAEDLWLEMAFGADVDDFLDTALLASGLLKSNPINVPIDREVVTELQENLQDWKALLETKDFEGPNRMKMEQVNVNIGNK